MHIQWYPGHMTKAMRMMQDHIKQVDCVVYVLDCRAIASCMNPEFDRMIAGKPVLYVLNKSDLVEASDLIAWQNAFRRAGKEAVVVNSVGGRQRNQIVDLLKKINASTIERYAAKGANKSIRAMVVGVPNTGKSTLINSLCGSKRTVTGNRPGVTRGKQWISLAQGIELLDTPGTLPPAFEDQTRALHLAFIGSIKEDVVAIDELALELIAYCRAHCPQAFMQRYKLERLEDDNVAVMDDVAKSRGFLLGRNGYDYDRTAKAVADDFKKQKLGNIMLDDPKEFLWR